MTKVLITGGAGFIGSNIAERLQHEARVVIFDDFTSGKRENLHGLDAEILTGDVRDVERLREACRGVEVIFHLAAQVSVPRSLENPVETAQINSIGTLNLLKAAAKQGVRHIVLSSSSAVYGDNPVMPKEESMLPEPKSPYAVSKLDGEYYVAIFGSEYGLDGVSLRYFNVFGPRQDPSSAYAAVIPAFIRRAIDNRDLIIYGDGEQTRDFVYVDDVVTANLLAAGIEERPAGPQSTSGLQGVYNVGCGRSISILELARKIVEIIGSRSRVIHEPERPGDVRHSRADISRIERELGFRPQTNLEEGLERTVRYFMKQS